MARRTVAASFVLGSLALVAGQSVLTQGCTQDFSTFDASGGGGPSGSTSTGPGTTTTSGSPAGSTSQTTTSSGGGEGGSVTTGGGSAQGGGGSGGGCVGVADCDDDNPCTTDACTDGVCDHVAVANGPIGGADDPEDCRNHECTDGVEIDEPDNDEDPADANPPCELTICAGGAPTPDFADEGTSCGPSPQVCDGAGVCVGCDPDGPDTQCGAVTECSAPTCENDSTCNPGFLDDTTVLPDPVDGDCQKDECPGDNVNAASVADDTDVPADLPCADGGCDAGATDFTTLDEGDACNGQAGVCDGLGNLAANCHTCRDTANGNGTDAGCTNPNRICDETAGGGVGQCRLCIDSAGGSGTDIGCADTDLVCDPAGVGTCVDCYTDGGGVAVNCAADEVCEPTGTGVCRTCYDLGAGATDAGCDAATPACDETNDQCEECQDTEDCEGNAVGPRCNRGGGTLCGCMNNPDCTGSPRGEVCSGTSQCGCSGPGDCDHVGSLGPNCNSGVCAP